MNKVQILGPDGTPYRAAAQHADGWQPGTL
jgi:hypothetical protein